VVKFDAEITKWFDTYRSLLQKLAISELADLLLEHCAGAGSASNAGEAEADLSLNLNSAGASKSDSAINASPRTDADRVRAVLAVRLTLLQRGFTLLTGQFKAGRTAAAEVGPVRAAAPPAGATPAPPARSKGAADDTAETEPSSTVISQLDRERFAQCAELHKALLTLSGLEQLGFTSAQWNKLHIIASVPSGTSTLTCQ